MIIWLLFINSISFVETFHVWITSWRSIHHKAKAPSPLLTLQVCPSSRAALWASTGLSMTRPVRPEKSMATREFSDTLRCKETLQGGRVGGGRWAGGGGTQGWWWWWCWGGGETRVKGQTSQTQSLMQDKSCLQRLTSIHTCPSEEVDKPLVSCSN